MAMTMFVRLPADSFLPRILARPAALTRERISALPMSASLSRLRFVNDPGNTINVDIEHTPAADRIVLFIVSCYT
jgi:hypothetical protein